MISEQAVHCTTLRSDEESVNLNKMKRAGEGGEWADVHHSGQDYIRTRAPLNKYSEPIFGRRTYSGLSVLYTASLFSVVDKVLQKQNSLFYAHPCISLFIIYQALNVLCDTFDIQHVMVMLGIFRLLFSLVNIKRLMKLT